MDLIGKAILGPSAAIGTMAADHTLPTSADRDHLAVSPELVLDRQSLMTPQTPAEWEAIRPAFKHFYKEMRMPLPTVMSIMADRYRVNAT